MSLLTVIIALVVVGVLLWLINAYVPMDPTVKKILNIVVILVLVIWLLKAFGVWGELSKVRVENNRVVHPAFLVSDIPLRILNNHFKIMPDVEVTNRNGKMYYKRKGTETERVLFEIQSTTNVVIDGIKSGGYFTEIQFPDDPGTLIRPSRGEQ